MSSQCQRLRLIGSRYQYLSSGAEHPDAESDIRPETWAEYGTLCVLGAILSEDGEVPEDYLVDDSNLLGPEGVICSAGLVLRELNEGAPVNWFSILELSDYLFALDSVNNLVCLCREDSRFRKQSETMDHVFRIASAMRLALSVEAEELALFCMYQTLFMLMRWFVDPSEFLVTKGSELGEVRSDVELVRSFIDRIANCVRSSAERRVKLLGIEDHIRQILGPDVSSNNFRSWRNVWMGLSY